MASEDRAAGFELHGSEAARVDGLQVVQVQVHQVGTEGQITAVSSGWSPESHPAVEGLALSSPTSWRTRSPAARPAPQPRRRARSDHVADATLTRRVGNRVVLLSGPPEMLST
jgi:hypothetical protein